MYQPEFLDEFLHTDNWFQSPRDGWKDGQFADDTFVLGLSVLQQVANERRLVQVRADRSRIQRIAQSMRRNGIDQPLILVVDKQGRLALMDGHHRVVCATEMGWESLPVRLVRSDRLRSSGVSVHEILGDILTSDFVADR